MTSIRWISEFMAIPIMLNLVANSIWRYLPTRWNLDIWISATLTLLALAIWHQSRRMPARGGMAPKTPLPPDSDGLDSAAARVAELRLRLIGARHHHDLDLVIAGIEAALAECELDPSSSPLSPRMASVRAELRRLHGQAMEARHPRAAVHCDVGDAAEYEVEARSPREERQLSLPRLEEFATGTNKHSLALPALANRDSLAYALCAVTLVLCFALLIGRAAAP